MIPTYDQTASKGRVGFCLQYKLPKYIDKRADGKAIVLNGSKATYVSRELVLAL